ncbi:hypothetical protein MJO28_001302 [Puccinia striiformis f. sp. tritici]|uniref:Uncharacterized protein n=1 Tax=Puccinia striiformis f. sp. tritici TaxID=168172 RepID=A0ACC0EVA4_9BASI|nr:hypothetical protein MJO28_001302 [Puccinia striiformis f. sp. tritici]KAI7965560.1 hypothetical protein MJO29_001308 [Puccinia striiformis f. sp. tritici]
MFVKGGDDYRFTRVLDCSQLVSLSRASWSFLDLASCNNSVHLAHAHPNHEGSLDKTQVENAQQPKETEAIRQLDIKFTYLFRCGHSQISDHEEDLTSGRLLHIPKNRDDPSVLACNGKGWVPGLSLTCSGD